MTDAEGAVEIVAGIGLLTVQDRARSGLTASGFGPAGPVDEESWRWASAAVGDEAGPVVEVLGGRATLVLSGGRDRVVAVGGPGARVAMDGVTAPAGPLRWRPGSRLEVRVGGLVAYVAVGGGLAVEPVLGSAATDLRAGLGGHQGRALRPGDRLALRPPGPGPTRRPPSPVDDPEAVRVCWAAQSDRFTDDQRAAFLGTLWRVGASVDRRAVPLEGGADLRSRAGGVLRSAPTLTGDVQVAGDGVPRVLGVDRQPVGGYPRLATVIAADLDRLARRRAGEEVRFELVTPAEAAEAARERRRRLDGLRHARPEDPVDPGGLAAGPPHPGWG